MQTRAASKREMRATETARAPLVDPAQFGSGSLYAEACECRPGLFQQFSKIAKVITIHILPNKTASLHDYRVSIRQEDEFERTTIGLFFKCIDAINTGSGTVIDENNITIGTLLDNVKILESLSDIQQSHSGPLKWDSPLLDGLYDMLGIQYKPQKIVKRFVVDAFKADFIDKWGNLARFSRFVNNSIDTYYGSETIEYKAPYFSLCQASGNGKSRLLCEFAKRHSAIYFSLGSQLDSCYPRPSTFFVQRLGFQAEPSTRSHSELTLCRNLLRLLEAALRTLRQKDWNAQSFFESQQVTNLNSTVTPLEEIFDKIEPLSLANGVTETVEHLTNEFKSRIKSLLVGYKSAEAGFPIPTLILILDEARSMLKCQPNGVSPFRMFRSVLGIIGSTLWTDERIFKVFAIISDTTSTVASFMPTYSTDPSAREGLSYRRFKLLDPYFLVCNMDIFSKDMIPRTMDEALRTIEVFKKGRPLWNGILTFERIQDDFERIRETVFLAMKKAIGGSEKTDCECLQNSISCLNMRVALEIRSFGQLAESLPSHHMRYITGITKARDMVMSDYPSDPVLSHAAAVHMATNEHLRPAVILGHLTGGLEHNLISAGEIGEVMTQFVYTLARDSCVFGTRIPSAEGKLESINESILYPMRLTTFTVRDLLSRMHEDSVATLTSGTESARMPMLERLLSGRLNYSHFVKVNFTPTIEDIRLAYLRGQAFACPNGQAGIDLLIPVELPSDTKVVSPTLFTTGERRAGGGIFENNDNLLSSEYSEYDGTSKFSRKRPISIDPRLLANIIDNVKTTQSPVVPDNCQIHLCNFGFVQIQVKNTIDNENAEDKKNHPGNCGILETNTINIPFLAIRHVLKGSVKVKNMNVEKLEQVNQHPYRFGLVIGSLNSQSSPCLLYNKFPNDEDLGQMLLKVVDARMEPFLALTDSESRFALAKGGFINKLKFSSHALDKLKESINEPDAKKRKT